MTDYSGPILAILLNAFSNHTNLMSAMLCMDSYSAHMVEQMMTHVPPYGSVSMYFCFSMDHFPGFIRGGVQPSDGRAIFVPRPSCLCAFPTHSGLSRCMSESAFSELPSGPLSQRPLQCLRSDSFHVLTQTLNVLGEVERRLSCD